MSPEQQNLFDVRPGHAGGAPLYVPKDFCERKHGGNAESEAAFKRMAPTIPAQRAMVLDMVRNAGPEGLTCKELAARLGVGMNVISGRFTENRVARDIVRKIGADGWPVRRDGCAVYVAKGVSA